MWMKAAVGVLVAALLTTACGDSEESASQREADPCPGASAAVDEVGDATRPEWDLRRLELHADDAGMCVRWTTDAPAPSGTKFFLGGHGPFQTTPGGAVIAHGYGFYVELREDGAEITFGVEAGSGRPNVLRGRVGQSGDTVSAFVPRSELDRPPGNMPDRPPFPYDAFVVEARVLDAATEDIADEWPQERPSQAGYVDGKLCLPPCSEPKLFDVPGRPGV